MAGAESVQILKRLLPRAEFIAVDVEFTGLLATQDRMPKHFDPIELRFQEAKTVADMFTIIQLGICVFYRNTAGELIGTPLSFLIRPAIGTFTCQASSVRFLAAKGGFDFNELFRSGLPSDTDGCLVMRLVSESRAPLVMHNGILDIMFLIRTFFEPIESTFSKFRLQSTRIFPTVYDSKLICSKSEHIRPLIGSFWLEKVYEQINSDEQFRDQPKIKLSDNRDETGQQHHDAAFDAYMTGVVFARARHMIERSAHRVVEKIESWLTENIDWSTATIQHYANRICLNRSIRHLDLTGGAEPTFRGVLRVVITGESAIRIRRGDILDAIRPVINMERVKLIFEDDETAFIILGVPFHHQLGEIAAKVNDITKMSKFIVEPFRGH